MKLNKLTLAAFMLFTFTGCGGGGGIYPQPSDKYPFEAKMKALLGDNLKIVNSLRKAEVQISSFRFEKDPNKLKKVINQLEKDGWILKGHGQGVDTYCLGANNSINIVSPTAIGVYDYQGGKLNITDYNSDAISYSYNKWGEDLCE
ncbi:TPA: hypothetical protein JIZ13_17550 [Acinetobacter nosocomialis]|uniref:Lipoprotein n=1 Tax=Acinetobacter nosocomialis TaxID=106654 RepID=A0A2L1VIK5_ACINO|nr:hypothetical protein [Acinetobacter nosocomialis]ARG17737.1 hypothetical protein B7L44_14720 [Acinetobacter nosocomialis]AVF44968.1 hypothetical protein AL533_11500 [Acinetobacter nosocomialis]AWL19952.1 hypothetical protein DIW83_13410 [Acinetobacter nosocomialis]MBM9551630.1 hypothetical protein [Acinetobacter nosocomialis]MBP1469990.1 hypothetical protein [Acinetobacter nosocomialis]